MPLPSDNFKFRFTRSDSLTVSPSQGRSGETLIVYYDFACMLEKFCLARDPLLFRNVVFMIDKFHLKNHTCSASYSYFEYDVCMLARTQVCEQGPCSTSMLHLINEVSLRELSYSAVFSKLRPVLETTCKSRSEDRAIQLTMFASDEYSRERNTEQVARLRLVARPIVVPATTVATAPIRMGVPEVETLQLGVGDTDDGESKASEPERVDMVLT